MMSRQARRTAATAAAAAVTTAAGGAAHAAWELVPEVEVTAEADDNPRLLLDDAGGASRMGLDARLRLSNFGQRGGAYIEPRVVSESYAEAAAEPLENEDLHLITRADYAWEQVEIGWRSNFREQSVLRAEFEQAIPDDPGAGTIVDTGAGTFGIFDQQRRRFDAAFNVDMLLSQRTTLSLELGRIDVGYTSDADAFRLASGFDDTTVSATLEREANERNTVAATLFVSEFSAVRNNNLTDSFGVEGSFTRPLSEAWTFSVTAGIERSDYRFVDDDGVLVDNASADFTFRARLDRRSERTRWRVEAGRLVTPNSTGFRSQRNQLRAFVSHELTPRLTTSAGLRVSQLSGVEQGAFVDDRDYSRATFEIDWALTQRWSLTSNYDWVARADSQVTSNSIGLGIRYRGLQRE